MIGTSNNILQQSGGKNSRRKWHGDEFALVRNAHLLVRQSGLLSSLLFQTFACRHCTCNEERTTNPVHDHHFPEGPRKESRVSTAAKVDAAWDPPNSESGKNILLSSYHPRVGNNTFIGWVEFPPPKLHHEPVPAMHHAGSTTPGKSALTSAMGCHGDHPRNQSPYLLPWHMVWYNLGCVARRLCRVTGSTGRTSSINA